MPNPDDPPRARDEALGPDAPSFFRRGTDGPTARTSELTPGKVVGEFRLVALIGEGGMGHVWQAEQLSLGRRRVAVKFVRPERVTEQQLQLFAREARAGGRLQHPGIVTVYSHGSSDGFAWIAMELVEGAWTLKDFIDEVSSSGDLPPDYDRHVARLVAEIADAVQAAHEVGVVHRDLKPQNVLITPADRPKVTDFGLARIMDEAALSRTGDVAGTYYYMSPEQVLANRAKTDHRTDVFSLGVVLYELLALQRPFQGDTEQQVADQIVGKDPPDPRAYRSRLPRDLAVIALKALEKERSRRYQGMRELADDLRRFLAHESILARPPTRLDRLLKWARRNRTKTAALFAAGVAFVTVTVLLSMTVRARDALAASNRALSLKTTESEARRRDAEANAARAVASERRQAEERVRADREAEAATRRAEEVLRLSSLQRLDDLVAEADRMWPPLPELLPRFEEWLREADALVGELPAHEATLAELRAKAVADESGAPSFDDAQDKWWHNQVQKLVLGLTALADPARGLVSGDFAGDHGWGIAKRTTFARAIEAWSLSGSAAAAAWTEACASIADVGASPAYGGLTLAPQLGLLPLGRDPASGLWEFAHLQSGAPAQRGADGVLHVAAETGIVLVLLPAGRFSMGAQNLDPHGANWDSQAEADERPVRSVTVPAFFLSKYEMTQGQWLRAAGRNPSLRSPSTYASNWNARREPGDLRHPVENVSWFECMTVVARLGLELPSEEQWEYGARAGTTTAWWCGDETDDLAWVANVADRFAKKNGGHMWSVWEEWDDGNTAHAPVGIYAPNPFGLHDVIGNIYEWTTGIYESGRDERVPRGGSFGFNAQSARSSNRDPNAPEDADGNIGLRPARAITP